MCGAVGLEKWGWVGSGSGGGDGEEESEGEGEEVREKKMMGWRRCGGGG